MEQYSDASKFQNEALTRREMIILDHLAYNRSVEEIASLETLAISSVKWYLHQVYSKLGVNRRKDAVIRARELGLLRSEPAVLLNSSNINHNLPRQLTSFIGREGDISRLLALMQATPLVTLTGSGGTGKTRLALQVAQRIYSVFPDGAWFVDLAPLGDPSLLASTVAKALRLREVPGVPVLDTLTGYLKHRNLLLILDNCEHVLSTCAFLVEALLKSCLKLRILTTSREIMNVAGETSFRVPSLIAPDPQQLPPVEELAQAEAVRLFVERTAQTSPGFVLDEFNAPAIATICHRLDGIPLAIELAAARVRVMPVSQITIRLDDVFSLLMGGSRTAMPRQKTLKATIDWSYNLLNQLEQLALQRLSVFSGGWTLEAAEAILPNSQGETVCSGGEIEASDILNLLASLVDKSLVSLTTTEMGDGRYRMLETIRQYASEKLAADCPLETGGSEKIRDQHLTYFLALAEKIEKQIRGKEMIRCLGLLENELDNLRLALEWSLEDRWVEGMRLASALKWFWFIPSRRSEGREWLRRLLSIDDQQRGDQPLAVGVQSDDHLLVWSRCINAVGLLSSIPEQMLLLKEVNVRLCRQIGDKASRELVWALYDQSFKSTVINEGNADIEEALKISQEKGYRFEEGQLLCVKWQHTGSGRGDIQTGQGYLDQALAIFQEIQDADGIAWGLCESGILAGLLGETDRAKALIEEGQGYFQQVGNQTSIHWYNAWLLLISQDQATLRQAEISLTYFIERYYTDFIIYSFTNLIYVEWSNGDFERASELLGSAFRALPAKIEKNLLIWHIYLVAGRLALSRGNILRARQYFQSAVLTFLLPQPNDMLFADTLEFLDAVSVLLAAQGDMIRAVRILAATEDLHKAYRYLVFPRRHSEREEAIRSSSQALGDDVFTAAWEEGRSMTKEQAVEAALAGLNETTDQPETDR